MGKRGTSHAVIAQHLSLLLILIVTSVLGQSVPGQSGLTQTRLPWNRLPQNRSNDQNQQQRKMLRNDRVRSPSFSHCCCSSPHAAEIWSPLVSTTLCADAADENRDMRPSTSVG